MPEGPEVKLTTEYLNRVLENKIIVNWVMTSGQYSSKDPEGFEEFYNCLPFIIDEVKCKGKLIYISCFNEFKRFYILHSMRMTGSWREKEDEYSRWYIELNDKKIWFRDPRCFATLFFTDDEDVFQNMLTKLGPDILTDDFTLPVWHQLVNKHRDKNITAFLMDQSILSGCGNYIKSEVLYYAKILPTRKVGSLSEQESEKLFEGLRIVSRTSYVYKGLSLQDYTDAKGRKGFQEFQLKIYGQKNAKRIKTTDGRTTYFDPDVQK